MIKEGAVFLGFGLIFCMMLYYILLKNSVRLQIRKQNTNAERWAPQSKPLLGGVGFIVLFALAAIYWFIFVAHSVIQPDVWAIIFVVAISFVMGLVDDIRHSSPYFKLAIQAISAIILISVGLYINVFDTLWLNYAITFFWVVGIMNSINMLDNMDAITASTSTVIIAMMTAIQIMTNQTETFLFLVSISSLASLLAFLLWNWHPAKMYMGDNGSQFLGVILAILGIRFGWNLQSSIASSNGYLSLTTVLLLFIVPLSDTTTVTINRLRRGQSPFVGGRDHTTHHLSYCGLKDNKIAILLLIISIVACFMTFFINFVLSSFTGVHFIVFTSFAVLIFAFLYATTIFGKKNR